MTFGLVVSLELPDDLYRSKSREELGEWVKLSYLDLGARFKGGESHVELLAGGFPVGSLICRICGKVGFSSPCEPCVSLLTAKLPPVALKSASWWLRPIPDFWLSRPLYVVVWMAGLLVVGFAFGNLLKP